MKALILNSGTGSRMGDITKHHPKCMTTITEQETILSKQLRQLCHFGVEVVVTTGLFHDAIVDYIQGLNLPQKYQFVKNPNYNTTNYIYSIYCARALLDDDIILLHGDLVFDDKALAAVIQSPVSCMTTSSTLPLPEKDFKAVVEDGRIQRIGIEFFEKAQAAQPLYKLLKEDWKVWLDAMVAFCEEGQVKCYGENAFNQVWENCPIYALDVKDILCGEIDTPEDLATIRSRLEIN